MNINFDNTYAQELEGFYVPWTGAVVPSPEVVQLNVGLAIELGLDLDVLRTAEGAAILSGSTAPVGAHPLAQAYAGHQFGGFSPQLGDGRALLIGEVIDTNGQRRDIHLKGSGRTPFSRGGDGKAVLGPVLREYLIGEAMYALGVPTTRALAAVTTGEQIFREGPKPGAVLARVASSHLRVGTFQFFAARGETDKLKTLAEYSINRHFSKLAGRDERFVEFLSSVVDRQAALVASWMHVGFVHGVMNTDNTTISGETIDYGPCAFIDNYDPGAVFSSIDQNGRYSFANQPGIAQWNLARLAETLLPLSTAGDPDEAVRKATEAVESFAERYQGYWLDGMRGKIGLFTADDGDSQLVFDMLELMEKQNVDYTLFFRHLAEVLSGSGDKVRLLFSDPTGFESWLERWNDRLKLDIEAGLKSNAERSAAMNAVNPLYIPRNHKVEEALNAAETDADFAPFSKLLDAVTNPYVERDELQGYELPAPSDFGPYRTFCGT